jgi:hypothetical protein
MLNLNNAGHGKFLPFYFHPGGRPQAWGRGSTGCEIPLDDFARFGHKLVDSSDYFF